MPEKEETPSTVVHAGLDLPLSEPGPDAARLSGASTHAQKGARLCLTSDVPATPHTSVKTRVSGREAREGPEWEAGERAEGFLTTLLKLGHSPACKEVPLMAGQAQDPSLRLPGMAGVSSSATVRDPEAHTSLWHSPDRELGRAPAPSLPEAVLGAGIYPRRGRGPG